MRVSKYIHACLLVEDGDDKILFDPGKFSLLAKGELVGTYHSADLKRCGPPEEERRNVCRDS